MGSDDPISRKPSADDWEAYRSWIIRLYLDENLALSAIQDRLREDHNFLTTHRTFKSKLKAWGIRKYIPSQEMGAILQDLVHTHRTDLTQRTGIKTVSVKGRSIEMAQVKRYIRRKGLPWSDIDPAPVTQASQTAVTTCSPTPVPLSMYTMKGSPHTPTHDEDKWQSIREKSNYIGLCPMDLSFHPNDAHPYWLTLEYSDSTLPKRTLASTSGNSIAGEDRQPKRQRSSHLPPTWSNFACPFYKNNPSYYNPLNPDAETGRRYRPCAGPGWATIRRLREHLLRAHENDLHLHSVRAQLKHIERGLPEQQWIKIYLLLFPGSQRSQIPNPYYDCEFDTTSRDRHVCEDSNGGIRSFVSYLHNVLPSRIRGEITKQISSQNQVPSADMIDHAIHNCLDQTGNEWLQGQDVQPVDYQHLACQPWETGLGASWPSHANTPPSSLDQSLSLPSFELEYHTPGSQNEMPAWAWQTHFQNGNAQPASIETGISLYRNANIMDYSGPSSTSNGFTCGSDSLQWCSGDPHDIIVQ